MDTKGSLLVRFSLLLFLGFQHARAHPIDTLSPAKELASMEALLERLGEKISLMEELQDNQNLEEEPDTPKGSLTDFSNEGFDPQPETRLESSPYFSDRSALLKRMRGLQAPKSMRDSGCFGRRLDRIGNVSGMGCSKGLRRN